MTIPAFLSVDVEPDAFQLSRRDPQPWEGYGATFAVVERLRSALSARTGESPRFGRYFRTDPQIAEVYGRPDHVLAEFPDRVARLQTREDYFGVHAHAIRWSEPHHLWVHDFGDASWHAHDTRFALDAYARWAGAPALRFRSGGGFLTNGLVNVIDQCGVKVDLTLEPVSGWGLTTSAIAAGADSSPILGAYTDCHTAPRVPYRPAHRDFRVRARRNGRLFLIPLATSTLVRSQPSSKRTAKWLLGRRSPAQVLYRGAGWANGRSYRDLVERQLGSCAGRISPSRYGRTRPTRQPPPRFAGSSMRSRSTASPASSASRTLSKRSAGLSERAAGPLIAAIHIDIVGAVLCWCLAGATFASAEGAWSLWVRACNARSEVCGGEWQRRQTYEAERWCRAARTVAVNQALMPAGRKVASARGIVPEYECFPDTVDPRGPERGR